MTAKHENPKRHMVPGPTNGQLRRALEGLRKVSSEKLQMAIESGLWDGFCEMLADPDFGIDRESFINNWMDVFGLDPKTVVDDSAVSEVIAQLGVEDQLVAIDDPEDDEG